MRCYNMRCYNYTCPELELELELEPARSWHWHWHFFCVGVSSIHPSTHVRSVCWRAADTRVDVLLVSLARGFLVYV